MPRHAAGDRMNGEPHIDAALGQLIVQFLHAVLGLGHRHAVAGDDHDQVGLLHDLGRAFGRFAFDGLGLAAGGLRLHLAERAEQHVGERAVHRPAHDDRQDQAARSRRAPRP